MEYYTPSDVYKLESKLVSLNISTWSLMQQAGSSAFNEINKEYENIKSICVFCGWGNNAGDGYTLAKAAAEAGRAVTIIELDQDRALSDNTSKARGLLPNNVSIKAFTDNIELTNIDLIVDAMLGIGSHGDIIGVAAQAINLINNSKVKVVSLDIPSGLDPDTGGLLGVAVTADLTITFLLHKICLVTGDGVAKAGNIKLCKLYDDVVDDLTGSLKEAARSYNKNQVLNFIPSRYKNSHKGDFGNLLVIAGDDGYLGALFLVVESLLKLGAGVIRVITTGEHVFQLIAAFPSVIAISHDNDKLVNEYLNVSDSILVGPGLINNDWVGQLLPKVLSANKKVVLDAGALRLLKDSKLVVTGAVVTPHPGEAADLLGITSSAVQGCRLKSAYNISENYKCVCVLKGAGTIIAFGEADNVVCTYGNPGMAVAGMGDVLSAMVLCFISQFNDDRKAVVSAVYLHSMAADYYACENGLIGMTPSDVINVVNQYINKRL